MEQVFWKEVSSGLRASHDSHVHLVTLPTLPKSPQFSAVPGGTVWRCLVDKCDYSAARAALSLESVCITKITICII